MPLHTNSDQSEADRLAVLQEYAVVDTALEPEFDLLARIAAEICGTEMAGINLVPHEHSFCEHTVAVGSTIVVADALADERFRDSPLVTGGPRIRFYAGAPLKARGGDVLGTLCVMDGRPRELSERQVELLEGLAKQVTLVIELRRDLTELDFARRRIGHDESLAHVAAWEWEVHSDIATWTPELRSLYGVGPELEGSYANFLALVHEDDRDYVSGAIEAALESGAKFSFRNRIVRPDGVVRTFDTRGEPWLGTDGEPLGLWGATADVTEIVESERRSREQLEGMQAAFLTALDPIFVADKERRFVQGNPAALGLLGYTIEQLVEMRIEDVVAMPPDEAIAIWESFVEVGHQRGELALRRADGSRAVAEFSATADFVPGLHLVVLRDVTERREAERDALESRRRLEETQSLARVGSWEWDLGTKLYIASDEMLRILERPAGKPQPTNKEFIGYVHPDDRDAFVEVVEQALRSAAPYRQVFRVITETGEVRTIESHGRVGVDAKGKPTRMFGAAQDITEREQVAQDLRLQAEVLDQLPVAVIASGADRRITLWNSAAQTIFGLDRAQALGKRFDDLGLASPAAESARAQMHVRLADGESWKGEIELQNAEGRAFPALVTNSPIRDHRGAVLSYVGVVVDMTEQRTIESELRVQGQILDQVQSAVITLDVKGRVTHWSKGAERLYGWTAEQMLGRPSAELDSSGPRPGITREHVQTEVISSGRWEGEIVVRHKDGTTIPVLSTCSAIVDAAGKLTGFIGVAVDISARKQAEEETHEARLETIKRLARAVETRDSETGGHIERIGEIAAVLAERLGLEAEQVELIRVSSPMHDVGKIGIADEVLLKPGALTAEERTLMERHAQIGHDILAGSHSEMLDMAALIALTHHERIDGTGYPQRLEGEEIPIEGRIVAVADVFDALTSDRVYRKAFGIEKAIEIMREGRGSQFDAAILDLLLENLDSFARAPG